MLPLLIAVVAVTALIGLGTWVTRRRAQSHRAHARWGRLAVEYAPGAPDADAPVHALVFPAGGTVAVAADGLHFAYRWQGAPVQVRVPWGHVRQVHSEDREGLCVAVARVGDLALPSRASHDVWETMNAAHRTAARAGHGAHDARTHAGPAGRRQQPTG